MDDKALQSLMEIYADLGRQVTAEETTSGALQAVTTVAVRSVPGVDAVSITRQRADRYETIAPTDDIARRADQLQYEFRHGPCIDAVEKDHVFHVVDLATDPRWPDFGPLAAETVGVRSVLSIRLALEEDLLMAGLNLYACEPDAFDEEATQLAMLLATHAGVVVSKLAAQERASQLAEALTSSRDIGLAMGVLMSSYKVTRDEAFGLLRIASQHRHRKLRDIAAEVAETGTLEL